MISKQKKGLIGPGPIQIISLVMVLIIGVIVYYFSYVKPLSDQGFSCINNEECNDDNPCTNDECSTRTGICYHPKKICPTNQRCNLESGECEIIQEETSSQTNEQPEINQSNEDISSEEEPSSVQETPQEISVMDEIENEIESLL